MNELTWPVHFIKVFPSSENTTVIVRQRTNSFVFIVTVLLCFYNSIMYALIGSYARQHKFAEYMVVNGGAGRSKVS